MEEFGASFPLGKLEEFLRRAGERLGVQFSPEAVAPLHQALARAKVTGDGSMTLPAVGRNEMEEVTVEYIKVDGDSADLWFYGPPEITAELGRLHDEMTAEKEG